MVGTTAPAFDLPDQNGRRHRNADYAGRCVVLFWYPKDATPGCTKEACGFRDTAGAFDGLGAAVLGASVLDSASKARFAAKYKLGFPLLADEDHAVAEAFGVWKEKSMYGRKYMGVSRETFIIGPDGKIAAHWPKAAGSESHAAGVLQWLKDNAGAQTS